MTRRRVSVGYLFAILLVVSSLLLSSCASSAGGSTTGTSVAIEIGRAAARVGLQVALQRRGVSPEKSAQIVAELRTIADAVIAGEGLAVVLDGVRWPQVRAEIRTKVARTIVTYTTVDGIAVIDQASAEFLAAQVIDAFAAAVRRHLVRSASRVRPRAAGCSSRRR